MNFVRGLFSSSHTQTDDAELGAPPRLDLPDGEDDIERRPTMVPVTSNLTMFRFLTGIVSNPSMDRRSFKSRIAPNLGIYARVTQNERMAAKRYRIFSILINVCLGTQIVVAAALTALGAANTNNHSAVTVFGAINTVIAGFLTFLKGSGLPNRLKYYQNEWQRLREYIEQRERDFSHAACSLDLYKTVAIIEEMYQDIKADVEVNTPESYISRSKKSEIGTATKLTLQGPEVELASEKVKALQSQAENTSKAFSWEVENKAKAAMQDVEKYEEQAMDTAQRGVQSYAEEKMGQVVSSARDEITASSQFTETSETLRGTSETLRGDARPSDA